MSETIEQLIFVLVICVISELSWFSVIMWGVVPSSQFRDCTTAENLSAGD